MAKSSIKSIWVLEGGADSCRSPTLLFKAKKKKRKKQLTLLRPLERTVRQSAKSGKDWFDSYNSRHNKSNRKRKNGWIVDLPLNAIRANNKAIKAFKIPRILGM